MSLSQDGFSYLSAKHSTVGPASEPELPVVIGQFMGVRGESHLIGERYGRILTAELTLEYSTEANLYAGLQTLDDKVGKLTGTLTVVGAGSTYTFEQATFISWVPIPFDQQGNFIFKDAAGNQWVAFVRLFWRQRK